MKINKDLQKDVQNVISKDSFLSLSGIHTSTKLGKNFKKVIYLTSLAGVGLLFNSCIGGYVATEPVYVETSRPPQPSNIHIWIDGDWYWSSQTHTYVQRNGYWERPKQNRTYVAGYWQTSPRGRYWKSGHWQRQGRQGNNHNR